LAEETEIPKVPHQDRVDNFFDSQGIMHNEFVPEGQTVNAVFYKGVMDSNLKCIQQVCPAAFCSQVCQIFTQKCYKPLSHTPVLSRFISARLFSVPQVENEVKGLHFVGVAEIQESVTDKLKKVQKEEFWAAFQKLYDCAKVCIQDVPEGMYQTSGECFLC
jgi:hypothetical protein